MPPFLDRPESDAPESFLPLTEVALEVLLALADQIRHGYGVLLEVEARTSGRVKLRPGTLYRALSRLTDQGLAESVPGPADDDDPRRQYYGLTDLGRRVLESELHRLAGVLASARAKDLAPEVP